MSEATKSCPVCGEQILAVARKCRFCGEYLDPTARPREPAPSAVERALLPVGRPASAIAAGYLGLLSFFPMIGLVLGVVAIICGVTALKRIREDPVLSGKGRAWFGIIAGTIGILAWGFLIFALVLESIQNPRR